MFYDDILEDIKKLHDTQNRIHRCANEQGRSLNREEALWITEAQAKAEELERELPEKAVTLRSDNILGSSRLASYRQPGSRAIVSPGDSKSYKNLFGAPNETWESMGGTRDAGFFEAVASGRMHPGLKTISAAMTVEEPGSGGFLIPSETSAIIHNISLEEDWFMPMAWALPMRYGKIAVPAFKIGDHQTNLAGGFVGYWKSEEASLTEADPKVREIDLEAKKLTGLAKLTNELINDSQSEDAIHKIMGDGLGWYRLKAWINGSGAGEPLGYMNSGCLVEVAKETGQTADTIMWENIMKMLAQFYMPDFHRSVWCANPSTIPQLLSLCQSVGTGGTVIQPAVTPDKNGRMRLLTRPIMFSEHCPVLGDKGDIGLIAPSQYVCGITSDLRFEKSIHVGFTTDHSYYRIISRLDGSPLWDEPLTLATAQEVSPFVVLAAR